MINASEFQGLAARSGGHSFIIAIPPCRISAVIGIPAATAGNTMKVFLTLKPGLTGRRLSIMFARYRILR